ncbi:phosphoribosylformylglycinamidine synthase [Mesohalobacter halotolerans]|uniref:Phosphoribosylformylglycinamidine synthase n=1 Tax=Mesohalobacter halotolerans TaxID=1883405 RepID=A0A4U5TQJ3_9FLAO|nr:phosphoribosylformylglycinamidine synthase [Mesohalobacter halotolerans]TKS56001.1 phosphoribosylformylglycinamidine synthase [Mesohalobacter halotolerans]
MISFFSNDSKLFFAVVHHKAFSTPDLKKLYWLLNDAQQIEKINKSKKFIGPRANMISPWSTNAVEITKNMGLNGIERIEELTAVDPDYNEFDPMLFQSYDQLSQDMFDVNIEPEPIKDIKDIAAYNKSEGLALSKEEVSYLENLSKKLNRPLTDAEVFGFSQVNSEHCRHKIFNGQFIIDNKNKRDSLFGLIKKTSKEFPNEIVSAYKDNVAFIKGPKIKQFAPKQADRASIYQNRSVQSVISLKAETHNFPTTVEPFNGAATGSGGEIRDRMAGGRGSIPLAGTAVYMTSYSRVSKNRPWEKAFKARKWLYQTPLDILIKASNGASDFGNKFGQPLICGSLLTFEHAENDRLLGYDKVIMLAGGVGYGLQKQAQKDMPQKGDNIIILGGDNYRIGMGGAAVSSADTGQQDSSIELNAVQRANPEMQKRVSNAIRALVESAKNPIISIHDHGAGGHLNCLSELVEETGGHIDLDKLPIGDKTLSAKELIGNESQERMGLILSENDTKTLETIAKRERAPFYIVGKITEDHQFIFKSETSGETPMNLGLEDLFGNSPKTIMKDETVKQAYEKIEYQIDQLNTYLKQVLQLEAVACKDWLTNKVDRCVTGRVAKQQTVGKLQLPLNNCGVVALDYEGQNGIATSIGHSPISGLINPKAGSQNSFAEALTNLIWAPLDKGLKSVSLSANWMWPCKNPGEDARLYEAVKAASNFAIDLGINIPTGKDSLSMKQQYNNKNVLSPGTVIISAAGHCNNIAQVVEPVMQVNGGSLYYINLSQDNLKLGGSSLGQVLNKVGQETPEIKDAEFFKKSFNAIQHLIKKDLILAGHDISSGGLITCLLEMCFADKNIGAEIDLSHFSSSDIIKVLFAENSGVIFQAFDDKLVEKYLKKQNINAYKIGHCQRQRFLNIKHHQIDYQFDVAKMRDVWFKTSYEFDKNQTPKVLAKERFKNYKTQSLQYVFPQNFVGKIKKSTKTKPKAAILREKGSNSEREMAKALDLAGFEVKDIHMTDLISGAENLQDIQFLAAVGGFSNSDVLGSAKGWAGSFLYNNKAKTALYNFFEREDTLSIGVCNGCQLFIELGLLHPDDDEKPKMLHNDSHKFECQFTSVEIQNNNSVMLSNLAGMKLGIWAAHGEGKFSFPYDKENYNIVGKYAYDAYPANPNGSQYNTAMLTDKTGRHLVMMPHIERSIFPWNWAYYPKDRTEDKITPWLLAFENAALWLKDGNISKYEK